MPIALPSAYLVLARSGLGTDVRSFDFSADTGTDRPDHSIVDRRRDETEA